MPNVLTKLREICDFLIVNPLTPPGGGLMRHSWHNLTQKTCNERSVKMLPPLRATCRRECEKFIQNLLLIVVRIFYCYIET
jgi:hypothetical protein